MLKKHLYQSLLRVLLLTVSLSLAVNDSARAEPPLPEEVRKFVEIPETQRALQILGDTWQRFSDRHLNRIWHKSRLTRDARLARKAYQWMNLERHLSRDPLGRKLKQSPDALHASVSIRSLQSRLKPDETLLNYHLGREWLYLLLVNRDEIQLLRLAPARTTGWLAERFLQSVEKEDPELFRTHARTLYLEWVEPVAESLRGHRKLLIMPARSMADVPFEMLLTETVNDGSTDYGSWPYLLKRFEVEYARSFRHFADNRGRVNLWYPSGGMLAVAPWADPFGGSVSRELPPLPLSKYEAEQVVLTFQQKEKYGQSPGGSRPVTLLLNEEANLGRIASLDLSHYSYIHFASHIEINEDDPEKSAMIFSGPEGEKQRLRIRDLKRYKLDAELVALVGCRSGRDLDGYGREIESFARTFIEQGVRNLIVSIWDIEDRYAAQLMIRFYGEMFEGASISHALQQAKLSLLKEKDHPFPAAWGSFVLITG